MTHEYIDPLTVKDINNYSTREKTKIYVTYIRMDLYNHGKKHGPMAIQNEMQRLEIEKIPSTATIGRILTEQFLSNKRTGYYLEDLP